MRLDINSGGLDSFMNHITFSFTSIASVWTIDHVIDDLQTIISKTSNIVNGVGSLQSALDHLEARKETEKQKKTAIEHVHSMTDSFMETAVQIDREVADNVNQNKEEFYDNNGWARPTVEPPLMEGLHAIINGIGRFVGDMVENVTNLWNGIWEWSESDWGKAVLNTIDFIWDTVSLVGNIAALFVPGANAIAVIKLSASLAAYVPSALDMLASIDKVWDEENNAIYNFNESLQENESYNSFVNQADLVNALFGIDDALEGMFSKKRTKIPDIYDLITNSFDGIDSINGLLQID